MSGGRRILIIRIELGYNVRSKSVPMWRNGRRGRLKIYF
jgi:hypothetical protein